LPLAATVTPPPSPTAGPRVDGGETVGGRRDSTDGAVRHNRGLRPAAPLRPWRGGVMPRQDSSTDESGAPANTMATPLSASPLSASGLEELHRLGRRLADQMPEVLTALTNHLNTAGIDVDPGQLRVQEIAHIVTGAFARWLSGEGPDVARWVGSG